MDLAVAFEAQAYRLRSDGGKPADAHLGYTARRAQAQMKRASLAADAAVDRTAYAASTTAPAMPTVRLSVGVTGHQAAHPSYAPRAAQIEAALSRLLDLVGIAVSEVDPPFGKPLAPVRLHSMLADGTDQLAAEQALARGWETVGVLPFGHALNGAINAHPTDAADARALLAGAAAADPAVEARAGRIRALVGRSRVFELADADDHIGARFLGMLDAPGDAARAAAFRAESSARVALAGRVMIEQSDLLVAVWDGAHANPVGGTGHTVATALLAGTPVLWVDPADPDAWQILTAPESLRTLRVEAAVPSEREALLRGILRAALLPDGTTAADATGAGVAALSAEHWRAGSDPLWHAYRWIERRFDSRKTDRPRGRLKQVYETPAEAARGSGAATVKALDGLPGADPRFAARVLDGVLRRFAWADGISAHLSDTYRGSMVMNFALSAAAVISGVAYLPFVGSEWKWPFAAFELMLLGAILAITWLGQRRRWHGRWFETRRVAEYLRHAPLLLSLGAARAPGRWPRGSDTSWPEHYARHALREVGLPRASITAAYLRTVLEGLIAPHVSTQRSYHAAKAERLATVHHNLDRMSERSFQLAVVAAALFLILAATHATGLVGDRPFAGLAKVFTFLGVALPTFGGCLSGIRFFGDFERFAAISRVTAAKLGTVEARIALLLRAPDAALDYASVAALAHAADDIVVSEIENWQAVFEAKQITVPA
jgi:hypothetical protein